MAIGCDEIISIPEIDIKVAGRKLGSDGPSTSDWTSTSSDSVSIVTRRWPVDSPSTPRIVSIGPIQDPQRASPRAGQRFPDPCHQEAPSRYKGRPERVAAAADRVDSTGRADRPGLPRTRAKCSRTSRAGPGGIRPARGRALRAELTVPLPAASALRRRGAAISSAAGARPRSTRRARLHPR